MGIQEEISNLRDAVNDLVDRVQRANDDAVEEIASLRAAVEGALDDSDDTDGPAGEETETPADPVVIV